MGLFDKLTQQGLGALKESIEKSTGIDLDEAAKQFVNSVQQNSAAQNSAAQSFPAAPSAAAPVAASGNIQSYFNGILSESFPDCELRAGATAASLGLTAAANAKPYDFALLRGGQPVGVVMLTPHNRDNNAAFKSARSAAETARVPFVNFYTHFPNEKNYVVRRLKSFIN